MDIRGPIIIIGAERSGTTLLYSILANHPDLYWLSNLDSLWPTGTIPVTLARRIFSLTKINQNYIASPGTIARTRGKIPPSECLSYWKRVFRWGDGENYFVEDDYFDERDLTVEMRKQLIDDLGLRVSLSGKLRLMVKQPGFSLKILFFNALFPDAIFLHMIRNPHDNHDSLVRAKLNSDQKLWGIKIPGWKELLCDDPSKQAVMQLKSTLEIIDGDIVKISDFETRFMRIRYENLVSMPQETIQSVLNFCNLDITHHVLDALSGVRHKRKKDHDTRYPKSKNTLDALTSLAHKYGYQDTYTVKQL